MYLTRVYIQDSGPLRRLDVALPFHGENPLPLILVGENGSGKTNLLSIIADALFECAAAHYSDVLPAQGQMGRSWFRLIGGVTITAGAPGGCAILKFLHGDSAFTYFEKGGTLPVQQVRDKVDAELQQGIQWEDKKAAKSFAIGSDKAEEIFAHGAYVYFPSSRAEAPYWLNRQSLPEAAPDFEERISARLGRAIYIERGLDKLRKWLTTILIEARAEVRRVPYSSQSNYWSPNSFRILGDSTSTMAYQAVWDETSKILSIIVGNDNVQLVWLGQNRGVGFINAEGKALPLSALSAGQATLFTIFGTLLRYANEAGIALRAANATGICVVDEIDAHMHVDLQYRALPQLVKMFPRIQFLLSSHSPLFSLGMSKEFGDDLQIVEMPTGMRIDAEAYSEFENALDVLKDTRKFRVQMEELEKQSSPKKLIVFTEGETDPKYLRASAKALNRERLLESVEFVWIGHYEGSNAKNTGTSALDSAQRFFRSKPEFWSRRTLLLYDCDEPRKATDEGGIHVRSIARSGANTKVSKGIENLLPVHVFTDDMYRTDTTQLGDGGHKSVVALKKVNLCDHLCASPNADHFEQFGAVLDMIEEIADGSVTA